MVFFLVVCRHFDVINSSQRLAFWLVSPVRTAWSWAAPASALIPAFAASVDLSLKPGLGGFPGYGSEIRVRSGPP
ncbi:MAG: hypothetical protein HSCHL_0051 [Hydrogenibacillus schlegelii]|uniref:Uncharacterized protein n=1 Tax=Hydrogenibacillus schlegelii TaxID=1484 RepID=A0A2T5GE58_HYDSH|nr:MAG: hypothetical protein HSCHL_0051 [Hydrogenibacillus schlegelii]